MMIQKKLKNDLIRDWFEAKKYGYPGEYLHKGECVGTAGTGEKITYEDNVGELFPITEYGGTRIKDFKNKILKVGETYILFDTLYTAIKCFGAVNLKKLYLKEQPEPETPTFFYYIDTWFLIANIREADEEIKRHQHLLLVREKNG